jgi:hypothetical protein
VDCAIVVAYPSVDKEPIPMREPAKDLKKPRLLRKKLRVKNRFYVAVSGDGFYTGH